MDDIRSDFVTEPVYFAKTGAHISPLFDQTKAYKSGSTIPIKLQLLNASNVNISSSGAVLNAGGLILLGGATALSVIDAGNANPEDNFRYDWTLGSGGGYVFNLSTKGLTSGTYALTIYVGTSRSFFYRITFQVK